MRESISTGRRSWLAVRPVCPIPPGCLLSGNESDVMNVWDIIRIMSSMENNLYFWTPQISSCLDGTSLGNCNYFLACIMYILHYIHIITDIRARVHFQCLEDLSVGRHATQMSKAEEERREGGPIPSCNFSFTDILTCIMHAACARACRLSPLRRRVGGWKKDIKFQSSPLLENFVSQLRAAT